jgi:DNA-binding XRE family transcriptional regulator
MKNNEFAEIAKVMRRARRILEITQAELGVTVGVTTSSIHQIELGKVEPGAMNFLRMWKALGLDFADLGKYVGGELAVDPPKLSPGEIFQKLFNS